MGKDKILKMSNAASNEAVETTNNGHELAKLAKPMVKYKQMIAYDENGEVVYDVTRNAAKCQNGGGFVLSYTEKMCEFLEKCSTGATVRVFLYIAHHQAFGSDGEQYGYRCTHKFLQQVLRLDRKSVYNALKSLKEEFLINETKVNGVPEFMVNPNYVTIGTDKKVRMAVWNKRWADHWKKINAGV